MNVDREVANFVRAHREPLIRYGLRRLDSNEEVEELVAETFATAWRKWDDRPSKGEQQLYWLYAIARLVLSNQWRSRDRRVRLLERLRLQRGVEESGTQATLVENLAEAIERLPDEDQEAIELAYWEHLSYREIGQVMGCSDNAVELRLRRAKRTLRAAIADINLQTSREEVTGR